jgi:hypothetical protein
MKKRLLLGLALAALIVGISTWLLNVPESDSPGAWIPSPVGSGTCISQGIPRLPNGVKMACPSR